MTTEGTTTAPPVEEPAAATEVTPEPAPPGSTPAELREHAKRQEAQATSFRNELLQERLEKIGLSHESGLGVAIYEHYDGEDVSVEALAAFAETKYGHKKPEVVTTAEGQQQTTASQRTAALDGQAQVTTPSQAPDEAAQLASQMLAPDTEKGIGRPVIESSITSKIRNWVNPPQKQ